MKSTLKSIDTHTRRTEAKFPFYSDSVIGPCERTQHGELEFPVLFFDSIQNLIESLESKTNLRYLDVGNLSDDYKSVFKSSKNCEN